MIPRRLEAHRLAVSALPHLPRIRLREYSVAVVRYPFSEAAHELRFHLLAPSCLHVCEQLLNEPACFLGMVLKHCQGI